MYVHVSPYYCFAAGKMPKWNVIARKVKHRDDMCRRRFMKEAPPEQLVKLQELLLRRSSYRQQKATWSRRRKGVPRDYGRVS